MSNIIDSIQLSGVTYTISGQSSGGSPTVELTQAEYDALVSAGTVSADTYYIITDSSIDYINSAQCQSQIDSSISGKADASAVTEAIDAAVSGKVSTNDFNAYSGATDALINSKASQSDLNSLSGTVTGHTANTNIHLTSAEKTNIDSLATNIAAISGITATKVGNWDTAYTNNHTHSNKSALDAITGNVGTMAYENVSSYSSATEVNSALGNKLDISEFNTYSGSVNTTINSKASQTDLNTLSGTVTGHTSNTDIHLTTAEKANLDSLTGAVGTMAYQDTDNYYAKNETSGKTEIATALSGKQATLVSSENIKTINNESILGSGNITIQSEVSSAITSGDTNAVAGGAVYDKFDEVEQVTAAALNALNANKQDKLSAGTGIEISGNVISATGGGGGNPTVELTQAEYDALVSAGTVSADTYYIITDAIPVDMSNYYTSAQTNTLLAEKQNTLVSGTNIKTINNESILGSGNISVEGKGVVGSGSISVLTGTTDYTINFTPSIWAGTGSYSIKENYSNNTATGSYSHAEGRDTIANGNYSHAEGRYTTAGTLSYAHAEGYYTNAGGTSSHAEGYYTTASGQYSHTEGTFTTAHNEAEHASGRYNVSSKANTTFGDSGNTLFSVGNGSNSAYRHNAFEIRQNGDIYIVSGGTDIKLQDHLGGGGSGTVSSAITRGDTNAVAGGAVYDRFDEVEQVTAQALNVLNESLSGKQDTLSAGTNITIVDNVISAEGGSITIDPTLDSGSTNPVANSAITTAINTVSGSVPTTYVSSVAGDSDAGYLRFFRFSTPSNYNYFILRNAKINGRQVLNSGWSSDVNEYNLVETSAITSAVTSASTDSQIPTAKAVFDAIPTGSSITMDTSLDSGSTNPVVNSAITKGFNDYTIKTNSDNGEVRYYYWASPNYPYGSTTVIRNFSINGRCPLTQTNGSNSYIDKFNLVETSAITSAITSSSTDAQVPSAKAVNDKLGGLSLVKLTQTQYDNLQNKDNNTLYVIVN